MDFLANFDPSMLTINNILSLLLLIIAAFEFLGGMRRGIFRQVLHTGLMVAAVYVSYTVTETLLEGLVAGIDQHTINQYLTMLVGSDNPVVAFIPYITFAEWLLVLPAATVVAPVLFTAIFLILSVVVRVVYAVLSIFVLRIRRSFMLKVAGGALGAVEGILIVALAVFPIFGVITMAEDTIDILREKDDGSYTEIVEGYDSIADQVTEHPFFVMIRDYGGRQILDNFSTITIQGEETNLGEELGGVAGIVFDLLKIKPDNLTSLSEEQKDMIRAASDTVKDSPYLTNLVVTMFNDLGRAALDNILPFTVSETYESLLLSTVSVFATTTREGICADIDTILEVYFLISDSGALKAFGLEGGESEMKAGLIAQDENGATVISRVVDILNANEHMKPIVTALSEMTIKLLADSLGMDYDTLNAYNEIKAGFNDVLAITPEDYETEEEYKAARDESIDNLLTEQGIDLDSGTVNELGDFIDENFEDTTELTDEQLNEFLLHYFEIIKDSETPAEPQ